MNFTAASVNTFDTQSPSMALPPKFLSFLEYAKEELRLPFHRHSSLSVLFQALLLTHVPADKRWDLYIDGTFSDDILVETDKVILFEYSMHPTLDRSIIEGHTSHPAAERLLSTRRQVAHVHTRHGNVIFSTPQRTQEVEFLIRSALIMHSLMPDELKEVYRLPSAIETFFFKWLEVLHGRISEQDMFIWIEEQPPLVPPDWEERREARRFQEMLQQYQMARTSRQQRLAQDYTNNMEHALEEYQTALANKTSALQLMAHIQQNVEKMTEQALILQKQMAKPNTPLKKLFIFEGQLCAVIVTPCIYYDKDFITQWLLPQSPSVLKAVLEEVFVKEKYQLMLSSVTAISSEHAVYNITPPSSMNTLLAQSLRNQHLFRYSCSGAHAPNLIRLASEGELIDWVSTMTLSTGSINAMDGIVWSSFCSVFQDSSNTCCYYSSDDDQYYNYYQVYERSQHETAATDTGTTEHNP